MSGKEPHLSDSETPLVIWLISDDKPGHVNQARGLSRAIESHVNAKTHTVPAPSPARAWFDFLRRSTSLGRELPDPDLILGVGHRTHPAMLAVRAARGGRAVVLMRPTLPVSLFDLAIVPEHDAPKPRENVIITRGVLNPIRPASNPQPDRGLILIGGPSRHVQWSDEAIIEQVREVAADDPHVHWELTTSPRTPRSMTERLRDCGLPNVVVTPFGDTAPGWVAEQLDQCSRVWVSADSVSMVYEALTAGAAVGVFIVPERRSNRVGAGLNELIRDGFVTSFSAWEQTRHLNPPRTRINEADRCAEYVVDRWFVQGRHEA